MRFVPLAMSQMKDHGTCVAGVCVDQQEWIRPIVAGSPCLFEQQTAQFVPNHVHELRVGQLLHAVHESPRFHSEDRIFREVVEIMEPLSAHTKIEVLEHVVDPDLATSLITGGRSLFLIKPQEFCYFQDEHGKHRMLIDGFPTSPLTQAAIEGKGIGVSTTGIPCTCPRWRGLAEKTWPGEAVTLSSIHRHTSGARVYLAMSLSRLYHGKHWIMAAGVHIVGEDRIWL